VKKGEILMKIIVLAAGRARRMGQLTRDKPKSLLKITDNQTILDIQLDAIRDTGCIDEIVFALGYRVEQIEKRLREFRDIAVSVIYNPFYDCSDNLITLWLSAKNIDDDFTVVNGDDIFKPSLLAGLAEQPYDKKIVMAISRKAGYDEDDMKVVTKGDKVLKVSKNIPPFEANGESVGMIRFVGEGRTSIKETLEQMVRDEQSKYIFYLEAIQKLINNSYPVGYYECEDTDWCEVDFHPDLQHLKRNIRNFSVSSVVSSKR
jgi:choline kinase